MKQLLSVLAVVFVVPLFDCMMMNNNFRSAFLPNYRYWPLSKARIASVLVVIVAWSFVLTSNVTDPPTWLLDVFIAPAVIWVSVAVIDMMAQNHRGYTDPSDD